MTQDEIMELAQGTAGWHWMDEAHIQRFASALIAAEREACAKVCEDTDIVDFEHCMVLHEDAAKTLTNAAAAIRARSAK